MPGGQTELKVDVNTEHEVVIIHSKGPLDIHPTVVAIPFMAADAMYMQILQYRVQKALGAAVQPVSTDDLAALRRRQ